MDTALETQPGIIEIVSVLGKRIRTTPHYWQGIVDRKHGELADKRDEALLTLSDADEVYQQSEASDVYLYYKKLNHFTLCVVARHLNGDGFIVTAYLTTKKKRKGNCIWLKTTQ